LCRASAQADRAVLQLPALHPQAIESAKDFMARVVQIDALLCPCCQVGRLHVVQVLAVHKRVISPNSLALWVRADSAVNYFPIRPATRDGCNEGHHKTPIACSHGQQKFRFGRTSGWAII